MEFSFTVTQNDLAAGTKYYYRSYYKVNGQYAYYTDIQSFDTEAAAVTVSIARSELEGFKGASGTVTKTITSGDLTVQFAGAQSGSGDNAYVYMRPNYSHHFKFTAPKAIKSIVFNNVNANTTPSVVRAKTKLSDETTDADDITSVTLNDTNAVESLTLTLTGDAKEVYITVSNKTYFKGGITVTY